SLAAIPLRSTIETLSPARASATPSASPTSPAPTMATSYWARFIRQPPCAHHGRCCGRASAARQSLAVARFAPCSASPRSARSFQRLDDVVLVGVNADVAGDRQRLPDDVDSGKLGMLE